MFLKTIIFAFLAVGVLAEYELSDQHRGIMRELLQKSCKANGNEDKVDAVENAGKTFVECMKTLFNPEVLRQEIEAAKPKGELDEVFKKYCDKSPQLKACINALTEGVSPCLDEKIREHMPLVHNSTDQLIDFVCFKDGDRIALFIAEGGPECFQEKFTQVRECATKAREGVTSIEAAKALSLEERCAKFEDLSTCIVNALEQCSSPTPGNMAESLLRYVRNGTPCKK